MADIVNVTIKTPDTSPPKLCIDCANHNEQDQPVTGEAWHFCTSPKLVDLVAGRDKPMASCDVQRAGSGSYFCGADAAFFAAQDATS